MTHSEDSVRKELWENCGEQLEMIPKKSWGHFVVPVLLRMVAKERDKNDCLTKRINNAKERGCV